jgi:hypothetical protein
MAPEVNAAGRMRITDALTAICMRSIANGDSQGARAGGWEDPRGRCGIESRQVPIPVIDPYETFHAGHRKSRCC